MSPSSRLALVPATMRIDGREVVIQIERLVQSLPSGMRLDVDLGSQDETRVTLLKISRALEKDLSRLGASARINLEVEHFTGGPLLPWPRSLLVDEALMTHDEARGLAGIGNLRPRLDPSGGAR